MTLSPSTSARGRFAPSPSGRMHLGNVFTAIMSYLSARKKGGGWIVRMEDLDTQRCRSEFKRLLLDDLRWLGLEWDNAAPSADTILPHEFFQSERGHLYTKAFSTLLGKGLVYDCYCTRADLRSSSAPHSSDGISVYSGKCRGLSDDERRLLSERRSPAQRLATDDRTIVFTDGHYGRQEHNLALDCGDFIIRRSDGNFAYQLAVVVDDALMGVTEVVRGRDLLPSTAAQLYLYECLSLTPPRFIHHPLLLAPDKRRLSKRNKDTDMGCLRDSLTREELIGKIMFLSGCAEKEEAMTLTEAETIFDWARVRKEDIVVESGTGHKESGLRL